MRQWDVESPAPKTTGRASEIHHRTTQHSWCRCVCPVPHKDREHLVVSESLLSQRVSLSRSLSFCREGLHSHHKTIMSQNRLGSRGRVSGFNQFRLRPFPFIPLLSFFSLSLFFLNRFFYLFIINAILAIATSYRLLILCT